MAHFHDTIFVIMNVFVLSLLSVLAISLVSFIGVFTLGMHHKKLQKFIYLLVAFSAGALFGDVFFHLLPALTESGFSSNALGIYI